jgi:hypothetical protein
LLAIDGFGEFVGYAFGAGKSSEQLNEFEFYRERYIAATDRVEYK